MFDLDEPPLFPHANSQIVYQHFYRNQLDQYNKASWKK